MSRGPNFNILAGIRYRGLGVSTVTFGSKFGAANSSLQLPLHSCIPMM